MLENHYLDDLFNPTSIAVIGASGRPDAVGFKVFHHLMQGQFKGSLFAVNPKYTVILNKPCYVSVKEIQDKIDLAIITTPAAVVPQIIDECGQHGIRSAIVISAGFSEMGSQGRALEQIILEKAQRYQMHFIGPNCLGVMRPDAHLYATFDNNFALPGDIALVSQSGAICAAILDWALCREIGFSTIVSIGNSVDLDFGDILEYLALDPATKSILLYIEGVHYPRRFMSGLRAAARIKPVIALKAGRNATGVRAVHSHTGALVGDDDVFSAALNRAGAVRVMTIEALFNAAQILSSSYRASGDRLMIITNGGGAGVMAADAATNLQLMLLPPSEALLNELNPLLPAAWSHQNPIDILGDATPGRYRAAMEACLKDDNTDALLTVLVPVAMSQPLEVAKEVVVFAKQTTKPLIACWMGEKQVTASWQLFADHHIPCYSTPEEAVSALAYLSQYQQNQQLLLQIPEPLSAAAKSDVAGANLIMNAVLNEQRKILTTVESKAILSAFDIPVSQTIVTHTPNEALVTAESLGFPIAMKINSPDITHKQDVGGVLLNLTNGEAVRAAFNKMIERVKARKPEAKISGVTLEHMYKNTNYREVMIGVMRDKVFGPVISFGMGGSLVEIMQDQAVALPPLNSFLAQQLIAKTRAMKLLGSFRGKPPVNMNALINILLRVSDMVCELPQIQEMDINPLLIDENGAIAVDARIVIDYSSASSLDYFLIAEPNPMAKNLCYSGNLFQCFHFPIKLSPLSHYYS